MHGECKTDFVLHRARCGDYSGWVNGFLHVYGSELLPRLTGDSDGMWQFPRPGGGPEPTMGAALLFSQNPRGNDTGRTQQPPHQGPILAALTAPPRIALRSFFGLLRIGMPANYGIPFEVRGDFPAASWQPPFSVRSQERLDRKSVV
mgnify:FL=1